MDDSNLYTVNVFKILNDNDMKRDEGKESQSHGNLFDRTRQLKEFQNMRSAKIIQVSKHDLMSILHLSSRLSGTGLLITYAYSSDHTSRAIFWN